MADDPSLAAFYGVPAPPPAGPSAAQIQSQSTANPYFDPTTPTDTIGALATIPLMHPGGFVGTMADMAPRNPAGQQFADPSRFSNTDLLGLMGLTNDEKRGNWTGDLASLSNQIWNRQQTGNPGPQHTGTNNFANVDLSQQSTPQLIDLLRQFPRDMDNPYSRYLPWSGPGANTGGAGDWTGPTAAVNNQLYSRFPFKSR